MNGARQRILYTYIPTAYIHMAVWDVQSYGRSYCRATHRKSRNTRITKISGVRCEGKGVDTPDACVIKQRGSKVMAMGILQRNLALVIHPPPPPIRPIYLWVGLQLFDVITVPRKMTRDKKTASLGLRRWVEILICKKRLRLTYFFF